MYARKRIDVGWSDLAAGLAACASPGHRSELEAAVEGRFEGDALACLSVRTGLDLYLDALDLPAGSEVLVTALTIPDMARVLERHGLVPVPVDLDLATLAPRPRALERAATGRTRAVLAAHLFGGRFDLAPCVALARERGWLVLEDCAQAFHPEIQGSPGADVSMFSFGPIKTATALGGAVLRVRDDRIRAAMRVAERRMPVASRRAFARRLGKYAVLKALSTVPLYTPFALGCRLADWELDGVLGSLTRGFPGDDLFAQIRQRPCVPLVQLLARRLDRLDLERLRRRERLGETLAARLPESLELAGRAAPVRTHWVFPVLSGDPARLVRLLRGAGFDATRRATLDVVPAPEGRAPAVHARRFVERVVYVPVSPELTDRAFVRLAETLCAFGEETPARDPIGEPAREGTPLLGGRG